MKVLHVDTGREMRGGQWQALYLMVGQKTIQMDPTLLAPAGSPLLEEAHKRGVNSEPLSILRLRSLSKQHPIVHAHDARSHTLAAFGSAAPVVVSRRVAFPVKTGFVSRWKYRQPARYLAISKHVANELRRAGIPEEKIAVVYDGVPLTGPYQGDRLITPSWDDARKGLALARQAAQLAGVDLHESIDLPADLKTARILLYLSDTEGLGSAALLAMGAGVPVIASSVGGLPEIVRDGETGLLVQNEAGEVAAAIRCLMDDVNLASRLGDQGREMVESNFTLAHLALRTLTEYKKVAA